MTRAQDTLRAYGDAFNRGDLDALIGLYATQTSYTQPFSPAPMHTPDEVRAFESAMFAGFTDIDVTLGEVLGDGDRASTEVVVHARHVADMPTPDGQVIPATGRVIELRTAEFIRVDGDGRIVEHHRYMDPVALMAQLGAGSPG